MLTSAGGVAAVGPPLRVLIGETELIQSQLPGWQHLRIPALVESLLTDAGYLGRRLTVVGSGDDPFGQRVSAHWLLLLELAGLALLSLSLGGVVPLIRWPLLGATLAAMGWRGVLAGYRPLTSGMQQEVARLIQDLSLDAAVPAVVIGLGVVVLLVLRAGGPAGRQPDV